MKNVGVKYGSYQIRWDNEDMDVDMTIYGTVLERVEFDFCSLEARWYV